jgi:hypothetical protein
MYSNGWRRTSLPLLDVCCLTSVQPRLQSNPHPKASLAWAAWIIAKLGGWNGYASSKPPGPITFFNGSNTSELLPTVGPYEMCICHRG